MLVLVAIQVVGNMFFVSLGRENNIPIGIVLLFQFLFNAAIIAATFN